MSTGSVNDLLAAALPIVLAVIMGVLGAMRGFWREAIVSASIVLGAFIVQQWASLWATDLYGMYTGASREWQQVALSMLLLSLIVLVLGYGLGTLLGHGRTSGGSRTGGLLLGLVNGSAIGGWLLRYIYTGLDGSQPSSPLYQNQITQSFMIWAGWFPVALAVIGAIVALIAPFRRSQIEVVETVPAQAAAPVWTPPQPAPAYSTSTTSTATAYGAPPAYGTPPPGRIPGTVGAATPYDRTVANPGLYPTPAPAPAPQTPYDAPRAQAFTGMDAPVPARDPYNPYPPDTATRAFAPTAGDIGAAPPTAGLADSSWAGPARETPVFRSALGANAEPESATASPPYGRSAEAALPPASGPEALRPSSDWLAASTVSSSVPSASVEDEKEDVQGARDAESAPDPLAELREPELPAIGTTDEATEAKETDDTGEAGAAPAVLLSNAQFCAECGTRVVKA
jgi:uncharacterized membrane protein required for colicin V production